MNQEDRDRNPDWRRDRDSDRSEQMRGRDLGGQDEDRWRRQQRDTGRSFDEGRGWGRGDRYDLGGYGGEHYGYAGEQHGYGRGYEPQRFGERGGERGFRERDFGGRGGFDRQYSGGRGFDPYGYGGYGEGGYGGYGGSRGMGGYGGEQGWGRDRWEGRGFQEGDIDRERSENRGGRGFFGGIADALGFGEDRRGTFAGKGPRGYRRNDDRIHEDVCDALTRDENVDASNIDVKVSNGEVTLTGNVDDRRQKRLAEICTERVEGVKDVNNQLRVQPSGEELQRPTAGTKGKGKAAERTA